jgi:hypothetical protein
LNFNATRQVFLAIAVIRQSCITVVLAMRNGWPFKQIPPRNCPARRLPTTALLGQHDPAFGVRLA